MKIDFMMTLLSLVASDRASYNRYMNNYMGNFIAYQSKMKTHNRSHNLKNLANYLLVNKNDLSWDQKKKWFKVKFSTP